MADAPIHLLNGNDAALLSEAMSALVERLVGDGDKTLLVDDHTTEDYKVEHVVDAARTLPFLTDRRIIVARGAERFTADELGPLVSYLDDPSPTSTIIVEWGGGRVPKKLTDAIKASGGVKIATAAPQQARALQSWLDDRWADSAVSLEPRAKRAIAEHLGEDVGRLGGLLAVLESAFGVGVQLSAEDVEPFLGQSGSAPPWDLTDALDQGGERHPLQIMASLHSHYERMLKLDGSGVRDEETAAELLGIKSFPAKKALMQTRRLGSEPIAKAIVLLGTADMDLKGNTGLDPRTVIEVLVARLAQVSKRR